MYSYIFNDQKIFWKNNTRNNYTSKYLRGDPLIFPGVTIEESNICFYRLHTIYFKKSNNFTVVLSNQLVSKNTYLKRCLIPLKKDTFSKAADRLGGCGGLDGK